MEKTRTSKNTHVRNVNNHVLLLTKIFETWKMMNGSNLGMQYMTHAWLRGFDETNMRTLTRSYLIHGPELRGDFMLVCPDSVTFSMDWSID